MRAEADANFAEYLVASDRHYSYHPVSSHPAHDTTAQAVRVADASWPFLTPAMQHYYTHTLRIQMMAFMADSDSEDRRVTARGCSKHERGAISPRSSSAKRRCSSEDGDAQQAHPASGKENYWPCSNNCRLMEELAWQFAGSKVQDPAAVSSDNFTQCLQCGQIYKFKRFCHIMCFTVPL